MYDNDPLPEITKAELEELDLKLKGMYKGCMGTEAVRISFASSDQDQRIKLKKEIETRTR